MGKESGLKNSFEIFDKTDNLEQIIQVRAAVLTRTVGTEEQILKLLYEYEASGLSVIDFCEVSDINEATYYSRQKQYCLKSDEDAKVLPAGQLCLQQLK